jgi:hypothetical protein
LGIRPGALFGWLRLGGKMMAVKNAKKIALVLWILAAAFGLFLTIHFSGHALLILEKCLAAGLAASVGVFS